MSLHGPGLLLMIAPLLAVAPGCASYAYVGRGPLPGTSIALVEQATWAEQSTVALDGACASLAPCAGQSAYGGVEGALIVTESTGPTSGARTGATSSATASATSSATASATSGASAGAIEIVATDRAAASSAGVASTTATTTATGGGRGLLAVAGPGITLPDGRIAALALLSPLAGTAFSADARIGGDASITCEAALAHDALPEAGGATSIVLRVTGGAAPAARPLRVHLVIDASTSMASSWDHLIEAALHLLARLRPDDELQIVVYGTDAREALAPVRVGEGTRARAVLRALRPGGRTHIEAGLRIAYRAIRPHASIVLLLSDGVPNGGLSLPDELGALAADASARGAITTAIGLGWDFHPGVLSAIATHGDGRFRIAPRIDELSALLDAELALRARIAAHDVELAVALAPGIVPGTLPAGVSSTSGSIRVTVPAIAPGEERVIVIPVEVPTGPGARSVARVSASWTPAATGLAARAAKDLAIASAPTAIPAGETLAVLDADLAAALALSSRAVTNGEAAAAAAALRDHAVRARAHLQVRAHSALDARTTNVLAVADALERQVASASWADRRAMGASMLSFSVAFGVR